MASFPSHVKPAREGFEPLSTNGGACREDRGGSHYLSWPPCWRAFREEGWPLARSWPPVKNACLNVCINEVMTNADGPDQGIFPQGEWVELYNSGSEGVSLEGWAIVDIGGWYHPIISKPGRFRRP